MDYLWLSLVSLILCGSIYKNITLGLTILKMEDTLEECLDVIEEKYYKMSEILKRPLFYDSPEVKDVVTNIKAVRNALHSVAIALEKNVNEDKGNEESKT